MMPPSSNAEAALLVHAYVDNELDPANAIALEQQIKSDPALTAEVARIEALRSSLRERLPGDQLPPHLKKRIEEAIELASRGDQVRRASHPTWRALAASLVLAVVLGSGSTWLALQPTSDGRMAEALVDSHIRGLLAPQPVDVMSSDRHTVKPWFSSRLPVSPRVVDLSSEGFPLIGGRIDVIGSTPTPTVVYGRRKHIISVVAWSDAKVPVPSNVAGYNLVTWQQNDVTYWAISDLNIKELAAFAQEFQKAL